MDSFKLIGDNEIMVYDYESLLESGKPSDVVLVVGGKELRAHKFVLSARSPVFAAMFAHDTKEAQENRVKIIDVDVEVLEMLVQYIYTGKVENLDNNAAELLIAADKYQVECLKSICEEHFLSEISTKTVIDLLIFADMYQVNDLFTECLHYVLNKGTRVMASKGWTKIVARADLMAKLCGALLVKYSQLNFCEQAPLSSIIAESVSDQLIVADKHQLSTLIAKSLDYIAENSTQVMDTKGWKKVVVRADLLFKIFEHVLSKYTRVFEG